MNTIQRDRNGHTLLELLFVTAILGILMMLTLPVMHKAQVRAKRAACMSQLRQVGIAAHDFAHDHQDKFPHQVSTNAGGTREFAHAGFAMSGEFYFAYRHFQALSNGLDTPKILRCPADHARQWAATFSDLRNQNVSYFAGLGADYTQPYSWLSGDGAIEAESLAGGAIMRLTPNVPPRWAADCHEERGNLLFADGHVEAVNNARLSGAGMATGQPAAYLLPPILPKEDIQVLAGNTTVTVLEQYFTMQSGGATPASASGSDSPAPGTAAQSKPAESKPVSEPMPPPAPRPVPAKPAQAGAAATNAHPPGVAAPAGVKPTAVAGSGGRSSVAGDEAGAPVNVFVFIMRPERNPGWWVLLLVLVLAAASGLGWRIHLDRTRRPAHLPVGQPRPA